MAVFTSLWPIVLITAAKFPVFFTGRRESREANHWNPGAALFLELAESAL